MNTAGALAFDAVIENTDFKRQIDEIERRIMGLSATASRESSKIDATFKRLGQLAAGYFSFNALAQLPAQLVRVRGEFQQLEIAFSTMLRSKAASDKLVGELAKEALASPFELKDIATGAKQLIAYGSSAKTVVGEIRMLGDVAAGVSVPITDLIYLYGTLRTQGRAYAVDIRQFAGRGVPIYDELAKVLGVVSDKQKSATARVMEMVEAGKVGFPQVEQAFKNMTSAGGMFAGLMEAQAKSLPGLLSNFRDAWDQMLNAIGKDTEGIIGQSIQGATELVQHYEQVVDVLTVMVATYGAYKTAVLAVTVAQQIATATTAGWTVTELLHYRALLLAEGAQKLLNRTMLANPYVLTATVLTGLIAAVALYSKETTAAQRAEDAVRDARERATESATAEIAKIEVLKTQISSENISRAERTKKLRELIAIAPEHLRALTLENVATAEGAKLIGQYIDQKKRQIELQEIESELTASINRQRAAQTGSREPGFFERLQAAAASAGADGTLSYDEIIRARNQQIIADETVIQGKIKERIREVTAAGQASVDAAGKTQQATARTVEWYEEEIKALRKKQQETATTRAEFDRYQAQIDALDKQRRRITGELTAAEKKSQKEADKVGPMGSISYWDNVAKKAQEVIDKTPASNKAKIAQQNAIRLDAERKAEEARKALIVRSFDEELDYKQTQYGNYYRWVEAYGKASADKQYAGLLGSGKTYLEYLNREIAKLESKQRAGTLSATETQNLLSATRQRDEVTGRKTAIDVFRDSLARARDEAKNLTDFLTVLKAKQDELSGNNSTYGLEARREVAQQIIEAERERRQQLTQFLSAVTGSEQQRLTITSYYANLRAALEKKYNGQRTADYQKALNEINKAEKQEFDALDRQIAEASDAFKNLNKVIDAQGREAIKIRIDRLKKYLAELEKTVGKESEIYREALKQLRDGERDLNADTLDSVRQFAALAGDLGAALSEVNGGLGETGRLLSGIASQANLVTVAFDESASKTDKIAVGVQGIIGLVSILTTSAVARKKAEEEYYRSVIAQQQAYNIVLNDQIGLQSELSENVFVQNVEGRLRDGIAKLSAANKAYQDALDKLGQGQVKVGQGNVVDWSKVGQGAASGAATGAAVGSIVPVIGTAIGAAVGGVVGGLIGLFGGKKKQDEFAGLLQVYPDLIKKGADGWEELDENLAQTLIDQNLVDENTKLLLENALDWSKQIVDAKKQITDVISQLAGQLGSTLRDGLVEAFQDGTDAAEAFGNSVSKILEDMLSQLIFNQVFSKSFDELQKQMIASYGPTGDQSWIDDFGAFFAQADTLWRQFYAGLEAAQGVASSYGLDIFKKTPAEAAEKTNTALSGAIKGVSEETASVLAGQINIIRINQAEGLQVIRTQLFHLVEIARNTRYLESIDKRLQDLSSADPLRAKGL